MITRRKYTLSALVASLMAVLLFTFVVGSVSAQVQPSGCFDAAGGPIPCTPTPEPTAVPPQPQPSDRDGDGLDDSVDRCPDQSGPADNGGCPVDTTAPTAEPDTSQPNSVRPPSDGTCQIATVTTTRSNVRGEPSLDAAVVGGLDPAQLYTVLSVVVNAEGIWYRVEVGWVLASTVNVGGDCPTRGLTMGPSGLSIPQDVYETATAGIYPDEQCTTLFNNMRLCQVVLRAEAGDGTGDETGYHINVCGFGPGGVQCTNIRFADAIETECPVELCEPGGSGPADPYYDPTAWPPPGWPNGAPADSCEALVNDLFAQAQTGEGEPYYSEYSPDQVAFTLRLPPTEPRPCQLNVYVPRAGAAADGLVPLDKLTLEIEFPQPTDGGLELLAFAGTDEGSTTQTQFGAVRLDLRGNACIPVTHGDFTSCPGPQPTAPTDLAIAPTSEPGNPFGALDDLISRPPTDDTGYNCSPSTAAPGAIRCGCSGLRDCVDMFINACPSLNGVCVPGRCICYE